MRTKTTTFDDKTNLVST